MRLAAGKRAALILCFIISRFEQYIQPYWLYVSYDIGVNIILAVSLNLINGYTGQFSPGHAGFMAIGAYTAALITNQFSNPSAALAAVIFPSALIALNCKATPDAGGAKCQVGAGDE